MNFPLEDLLLVHWFSPPLGKTDGAFSGCPLCLAIVSWIRWSSAVFLQPAPRPLRITNPKWACCFPILPMFPLIVGAFRAPEFTGALCAACGGQRWNQRVLILTRLPMIWRFVSNFGVPRLNNQKRLSQERHSHLFLFVWGANISLVNEG